MRTIDFKAISYPGKDKRNEDYVLCHKLSHNSIVAILADGMGGLSFGAEAAKIVSESIMTTVLDKNQHHLPADVLRMAFNAADSAIYRKCKDLKCKMGAAVTVALVIEDSLYYAWQGNVRLYKVHKNKVMLLTTDHVVADTEGMFLTRCINGKGFRENIPVMYEELKNTDKIYICSDGYYRNANLTELSRNVTVNFDEGGSDDYSLIEIYFT